MKSIFKIAILLVLGVSAGCVSAPDPNIWEYQIAEDYRHVWERNFGWPAQCDEAWSNTQVAFVDLANIGEYCDEDAIACEWHDWADGDILIFVPYNHQPMQEMIHELTHVFMHCTAGTWDRDHDSPRWAWQAKWANEYANAFSAIEVLSEQ